MGESPPDPPLEESKKDEEKKKDDGPEEESKKDGEKKEKDEPEQQKAELKNYRRVFTYGTTLDFIFIAVASLCSMGAGAALPLMNIVFGTLVKDFNNYFIEGSGVTREEFLDSVNQSALYIVYLFIGKFVLGYVSMKFSFRITGVRISSALRLAYLTALFKQPISAIDLLPLGRPTDTITTSSNRVQIGISEKLATLIQSLALVIAAYAIAFRYSWSMTLVSSSAIVFISIIYTITVPIFISRQREVDIALEKASSVANEALSTIRTIVACGAEGKLNARYAKWVKLATERGLKLAPVYGGNFAPSFFAMYANFALTFWFGAKEYAAGRVSNPGEIVIVLFSVLLVVMTMGGIATPIMEITKAASAATNFFSMIDAPLPDAGGLKEPEASPHEDITLENVKFSYPSRPNVQILDDLSLQFPSGKITAIVGPSGCGKSTIVALLERWYQIHDPVVEKLKAETEAAESAKKDTENEKAESSEKTEESDNATEIPNGGTIRIGPHDIQDLDLKWWRTQIGLVQQEPFSFHESIFKNVSYGLVGSRWENEDEETKRSLVREACKESFADEFIDKLPEGYDTMVGENGIKLSGGQRQRLAIARSIIKRPAILILDEATSSIDVRGERIVQEALDRVSRNRTTITIAHRLSTIKKADNIVVLKKGKCVEQGTHESLLLEEGTYYDLVNNQQLGMSDDEGESSVEQDRPRTDVTERSKDEKRSVSVDSAERTTSEVPEYQARGLVNSIGLFLWEQRRLSPWYIGIIFGAAIGGGSYAIQSYIFAQLISTFALIGQAFVDKANFWSLMFFVLALCVAVGYFTLGLSASSVSVHVSSAYRQQYFESIVHKPIAFYDQEENSAGTLTSRVSQDPTQLQELLGINMAMPLVSIFNICGCVAVSFSFGWKLTLVAMCSAFPLIIGAGFMRIRYELQFEKMNTKVFAESSQFASEAIGAYRTVTSLTLEDTIIDRYSTLLRNHVKAAFSKARLATLIFTLSDSIELLCMALCFWYGGQLMSTFEYSQVQFFVIYIAVVQGGQAAGQWSSFAPNVAQSTAAANRILSFRLRDDPNEGTASLPPNSGGGARIEFKGVHFKYPTRDMTVFKGLDLCIERGQFAALVGPSGCGKTTVISLLERFYDYQAGTITYDGAEISSLNINEYRNSLSLVSQEPTLYQGSLRENITLGVDPDTVTDEEVFQACRDAEIHDFITSLPEGYNTDVGLRGLRLSGGQKQRISIARALIRNPRVLLLDEATSSLDSESEKLVQASFERAAKKRTVIVVAHRLATVQNADVIYVFGEGGIVETGTHQGLLKERGVYWQMCQSQALDR
ncbi:hypothetical protein FQN54_004315 [Arachnomyces sp. PD_36]|nr:hypothetical protein FQN54_004315 [Arachnomyces sp. PD_36]